MILFTDFLSFTDFCWILGPYLPSNLCDGKATGNHEQLWTALSNQWTALPKSLLAMRSWN